MNRKVERQTVDLSAFPDLVVIYLGMRVNAWTGLKTLFGFGPQIKNSVDQKPDGLLLHEYFIMSLVPLHLGVRQYWRDFDALEAWSRSPPHREWWRDFLRSSGGTGLWHRGGTSCAAAWRRFTTTYPGRLGFGQFAPVQACPWADVLGPDEGQARCEPPPAVVEEAELYGVASPQ